MKRTLTLAFASLFLVGSFALAGANKSASHGRPAHGTVASLDTTGKTFVLKTTGGKDMTVAWNDATAVKGGTLKDGEMVEIRTVDANGQHVATVIQIEAAKPAKATNK
jgi:cold shock CspA family protein